MVTKFFIFCETFGKSGKAIRYLNKIVCDSDDLQEYLVHLDSIGVKVFKIVPFCVDEHNGLIKF